MNTKEALSIYEKLASMHPEAQCELHFRTPFQLLVAVILSAQCTDERVNKVTDKMFTELSTPEQFADLTEEELIKHIYSCGYYNAKAKNIIAMSKILCEKYDGEVPTDFDTLVTLPGVGQKTASVITAVAFDRPAVPVDTHVFRVARRLGFSKGNSPEAVERDIKALFPPEYWNALHHYMIFHGRYICHSRKPDCEKCNLVSVCPYYLKEKENTGE